MLIASGLAPDLDYASYLAGPAAFLRFHRTALHSIAGAGVVSCALALFSCALDRKWPPAKSTKKRPAPTTLAPALVLCAFGVIGHELLDLASGEGIQLLWPFHAHWYRWDLAESFDPWVLIVLVAGLLIPQLFGLVREEVGARNKPGAGSGAALATLLLLLAYLGGRAYFHSRAVDTLLSAEYHAREPLSAGAFPSSGNPLEWRGVVATDGTLEELDVSLAPGADFNPDRSLTHYKPQDSPQLQRAEKTLEAQRFLAYAEFPLASATRHEDGYRVEFRDLRFPAGDQSVENMMLGVDLDASARVVRMELRYVSSGAP